MIGLADLYADLRMACEAAGGQAQWAERHGLSPQYVCDVVNARKPPGPSILRALGWVKITTYRKSNRA